MQAYTEEDRAVFAGLCRIEIKRWKAVSESDPNRRYMVELMKIALAALTQKSVGTIRIEMDWNTHRNVATLDMREDLVAADMSTGDKLYTTPTVATQAVLIGFDPAGGDEKTVVVHHVAPLGWKLVPVEPTEEMTAAGDKFMDGLSRLGDAYEAMLAAAPEVE